ncbi:MAG TPA: PspC domain-containing protein [Streptosporangiaceae bacterium]|nr:PspC domain-containing protein [Streptosporangiaceae bacterium]
MNASDTDQESNDQTDQPPADGHPQADGQPQTDSQPSYRSQYSYRSGDEPLYRPVHSRMIAGVAAGIAQYLGVDVNVVRVVLAVLTFVGGAGIPVYLAGWLLIPDESASQSIASQFIGSLQGRTS